MEGNVICVLERYLDHAFRWTICSEALIEMVTLRAPLTALTAGIDS